MSARGRGRLSFKEENTLSSLNEALDNRNVLNGSRIRKLCGTAMLGAVAYVLMFLEFPVPLIPGFIKMDFSELPALIASFAYGPLSGVAVCLIKNLIHLFNTQSGGVGELSNFILGAVYVFIAGLIYKKLHNKKGAIIGSLVGAVVMALISVPSNYFIVYPVYTAFMPMEAIIGAYKAINPNVNTLLDCLIMFNLPFTFIKGMCSLLITVLVYKPLSPILHGYR
ncbi:MAG: ECF transporter S component [Lachnospiraceae bacterium]|nr:ECF transporter S component [Lachnospiraceae bacterium]